MKRELIKHTIAFVIGIAIGHYLGFKQNNTLGLIFIISAFSVTIYYQVIMPTTK